LSPAILAELQQDPGVVAESDLAIAIIEAETHWNDTAESATTTLGFVGAKTMAFFGKMGHAIVIGAGGAGDPPDLALVAGDLLANIFLSPATILRDALNSTQRLVQGSANGQDGLDLALGVVRAGASLVKGKAGALLKIGTLAKKLPTGSRSAKVVARLMTAEAALATGTSGVSRIKKIVEVANLSATAATLVGGILDATNDEGAVAHLNTTLENVAGTALHGVLEEFDALQREFGGADLVHSLAATGTPVTAGAPAAGESPLVYWKLVRQTLRGVKIGTRVLRGGGLASASKGIANKIKRNFGEEAEQVFKDIEDVARRYGASDSVEQVAALKEKGFHRLVRALASNNPFARQGAIKVLQYLRDNPGVGQAEVKKFVRVTLANGKTYRRFVDLITNGLWVELKNWRKWPSFPPSRLDNYRQRSLRGAEWQFLLSIVELKADTANRFSMVFTRGQDGVEKFSSEMRAHFTKLLDDPWLERSMIRKGTPNEAADRAAYEFTIQRMKDAISRVIRFEG